MIFILSFLLSYTVHHHETLLPKFSRILNNSITEQVIYNRKNEFDVVLSYYYENVEFVARFIQYLRNSSAFQRRKSQIIVYNKNSQINNTDLNLKLKADTIISIPNVGREGETYLYHIIHNYNRLAEHTFFCQAGVEGITQTGFQHWFEQRFVNQFNQSVGFMPMVEHKWMARLDCGKGPWENMPVLAQLWAMIQQTLCPPDGQAVFYRGQFIVSANRVRLRPIRIYKYMHELISVNETHWIHGNIPSKPPGSIRSNPWFGHVVERLWTTLFNCTDLNVISQCQKNQCACYD